ncbi:hypothetical protein GCM10009841_29060 [Microlunatus panaciterrae]|uniref:Catechol-2,3-dioxygenase n=1 Tax=Microlunatus panaciterrae TaxID=400768 RepID=A0ABS2RH95_9ACTN|nr:hypothetical protein [Microlunatus panaciterrae]MBM7797566.1 catechol-2,3-dioxygenase [Microlunatus panaciterrae]
MLINTVRITVTDVAETASFFSDVLQLPDTSVAEGAGVQIGASTLVLAPGEGAVGVHHLAFDVPAETFDEHRRWLEARTPLLSAEDGTTEFEGPPVWDSRSIYFSGPAEMVLELIGRRQRRGPAATGVPQLLSISEVGVAVPDVLAEVARLRDDLGLATLGGAVDSFAAVGDHHGLLILVSPGRGWMPTFDVRSGYLPTIIEADLDGLTGQRPLSDAATLQPAQVPARVR